MGRGKNRKKIRGHLLTNDEMLYDELKRFVRLI